MKHLYPSLFTLSLMAILISWPVSGQKNQVADSLYETERTNAYASQLENYLRQYLVDQYDERIIRCLAPGLRQYRCLCEKCGTKQEKMGIGGD